MVSLLLFDMQILGAAILILLVLHLAYGTNKQVLLSSPCAHPSCLPRLHNCSGRAVVQEEQVLLLTTGCWCDQAADHQLLPQSIKHHASPVHSRDFSKIL